MPQLPSPETGDYAQQVDLSEPYRKITPEARPGNVGQVIENIGNQAAQAVDTKNRADGAIYAANTLADMRVRQDQFTKDAQEKASPDGSGYTQTILDQFDKDSNTLKTAAATNPYASKSLQQGLTQMRSTVATNALNYESQVGVKFRGDSIQQNIDKLAPVVEADPSQWQSAGNEQMNAIQNSNLPPEVRLALGRKLDETLSVAAANGLARQDPRGTLEGLNDPSQMHPAIKGLSDGQREALRNKANDNLSQPIYDSLTDGDTKNARLTLDGVRDVMDPKTTYALGRQIDAADKEKQNEQKQDIADRLQDSMTGAEYGLKNPVTVTRAELNVLYPKDGQRRWDALQGMVEAGAKSKEYDQMTPEQITADLNTSEPTQGGPEAALRIKAFEIKQRAADASLKARAADPAQFALDSGTGWKPFDLSNPDDAMANLRSRANTQGAVSEQTGVNTPLLSKAETKQVTGWLTSQKPEDRVATLATLRATMPSDQSYAALLKQVAPGSPLTAIAGSMMDRPAQGTLPTWYNGNFTTPAEVPTRVLEGEQILQAKDEKGITSKFPMPTDKDLMPQFMSAVGGADSDLFRGRPETLESSYAAFKAYYAAEASHRGVTNGVINTDIAQKAALGVIGAATQYGSSNLVVPAGMDPSRFEGAADAATHSALTAGGYSSADIEALRGTGLRELGDTLGTGRYVMINGNGDPLKSKDGKKSIVVDLNDHFRIPMAGAPSPKHVDLSPTPNASIAGSL